MELGPKAIRDAGVVERLSSLGESEKRVHIPGFKSGLFLKEREREQRVHIWCKVDGVLECTCDSVSHVNSGCVIAISYYPCTVCVCVSVRIRGVCSFL